MRKMHMRTGSEGPTHDPYGYGEMEMETERGTVTLHTGLGCWARVVGTPGSGFFNQLVEGDDALDFWTQFTGLTPDEFERAYNRVHGAHERCPDCGTRSQWESGMVGEAMCFCPNPECHGWRGWCEDPAPYII